MIESIRLKNFECYKDTTIKFSNGVNFIVGSSVKGKSSIVRAIDIIRTNSRAGSSFVRNGKLKNKKRDCVIELKINGHIIQRNITINTKRSIVKNNYVLINPDGSSTEFTALNRKVPEEVSAIMNMSDINMQMQFDGFFLIGDTPGVVAKKFNQILGLDLIDSSIKHVNSSVSNIETLKRIVELNLKDGEKKLCDYEVIPELKELIAKGEKVETRKKSNKKKMKRMKKLIEIFSSLEEKKKRLSKTCELEGETNKAVKIIEEKESREKRKNKVENLINNYKKLKKKIKSLPDDSELDNIKNIWNKLKKLKNKRELVISKLREYKSIRTTKNSSSKNIKILEDEINKYIDKNPRCPICKNRLKKI